MAAKKSKWSSFCTMPKVKQPHSSGLGMSTTCARISSTRHVTVIDGHEFDVGRIVDGVPDEVSVAGVFEPAAEGVVPAQIGVDGVIHGGDIALASHFTAGDDLPGEVQTRGRPLAVVAEVLALHVADRHRTDRRLPGLFLRRGRRMPGGDRPGVGVQSSSAPIVIFPMRKTSSSQVWPAAGPASLVGRSTYPRCISVLVRADLTP